LFSLDDTVNWEAISTIGQLVGALAVVISLIYLANEVRSNARATRLAAKDGLPYLPHPLASEFQLAAVHTML